MKPALLFWLGLAAIVFGLFRNSLPWILAGAVMMVAGAIGPDPGE